jgi:hypothetical protein
MTPEKHLWQAVVFKAVMDATAHDPKNSEDITEQRRADLWIRKGGRDFVQVCTMAGIDPAFIREAYIGGRIDRDTLRAASETKR